MTPEVQPGAACVHGSYPKHHRSLGSDRCRFRLPEGGRRKEKGAPSHHIRPWTNNTTLALHVTGRFQKPLRSTALKSRLPHRATDGGEGDQLSAALQTGRATGDPRWFGCVPEADQSRLATKTVCCLGKGMHVTVPATEKGLKSENSIPYTTYRMGLPVRSAAPDRPPWHHPTDRHIHGASGYILPFRTYTRTRPWPGVSMFIASKIEVIQGCFF